MRFSKIKALLVAGMATLSIGLTSLVNVNAANEYFDEKYYDTTIPTGYYDGIDTSLTGDAFKNVLGPIISKNYHQHSYKENNTVLKYTDPDPKHPRKVIGFYSGQSLSEGAWNKEHVWAKSHGFPNSGAAPYCDAHHLRPTINKINSDRGNLDFGELPGVSADQYGNKKGDVFEPRDEVKGDVARIMFYMETRYKKDYNLKLVNDRKTSLSDTNGRFGGLQTLIKWHYQDPVSKEEVYRNNVIYDKFQHNRNPYIDHPEWVDLAYPNEYSNQTVDKSKVNDVVYLINEIPSVVTLADKETVMLAKNAFDKLNYKEKTLVTNVNKLNEAIKTISDLEKPVNPNPTPDPNKPIIPENENDVAINFATDKITGVGSGYQKNAEFTVNNLAFYASDLYVANGDVRLGHNKASSNLASVGINGTGSYLEPSFNTKNLKYFSLEVEAVFGGPFEYEVLFKEENTSIYEKISSGRVTAKMKITAELPNSKNGRFVFAIKGSKARAQLAKLRYGVVEKNSIPTNPFENEKLIGESFVLNENKYIRFGMLAPKTVYANVNRVGILVTSTKALQGIDLNGFARENNINNVDSLLSHLSNIRVKNFAFIDNLVSVDMAGSLNSNGLYYQYAAVINNVLGHEDYSFTAIAYIEVNGNLYFSNQVVGSFNNL